eukprot:9477452-Pyramimonas_sp.AAC.1
MRLTASQNDTLTATIANDLREKKNVARRELVLLISRKAFCMFAGQPPKSPNPIECYQRSVMAWRWEP